MMDVSALIEFLESLDREIHLLTELQSQKLESVHAHDLERLNDCIKQEQAISLSLRGMEQKRSKLLAGLGLSGVPLRELSQNCPPEQRAAVSTAVERLLRDRQLLSSAQAAARTAMERDLHMISRELEHRGILPESDHPLEQTTDAFSGMGHTNLRA